MGQEKVFVGQGSREDLEKRMSDKLDSSTYPCAYSCICSYSCVNVRTYTYTVLVPYPGSSSVYVYNSVDCFSQKPDIAILKQSR